MGPPPWGIQRIGCKAMWGKGLREFVRVAKEVEDVQEVEEKNEAATSDGETDGFGEGNMGNGSIRLAME